ncbi:MAG: hypothetical protein V1809_04920 [Planctomycetota bacterium]
MAFRNAIRRSVFFWNLRRWTARRGRVITTTFAIGLALQAWQISGAGFLPVQPRPAPKRSNDGIPCLNFPADARGVPVPAAISVKPAVPDRPAPPTLADGEVMFEGKVYRYWKTVKSKVTAYTPDARSCGASADGRTSTRKNAWKMNGVAAHPAAVPYGTVVEIPGVGLRVVDDTGAAMRKSWTARGIFHFDLRMVYHHQARKWGTKDLEVKLYRSK